MINHIPWPEFDWAKLRAPRDVYGRYIGAGDRPADVRSCGAVFEYSLGTMADRVITADGSTLLIAIDESRARKITEYVPPVHAHDGAGRVVTYPPREITRRPAVSVDPKPDLDFVDLVCAVARGSVARRFWPVALGVAIAIGIFLLIHHAVAAAGNLLGAR